jgi:hypothetical protein
MVYEYRARPEEKNRARDDLSLAHSKYLYIYRAWAAGSQSSKQRIHRSWISQSVHMNNTVTYVR